MKINVGIAPLFLLMVFVVEVSGQVNNTDTPDLIRDMRVVTLSRIENSKVERLSDACTTKRGRWIFRGEAKIDCFALQIDGFVKDETGESRMEYPLFISTFETIEEAEDFALNINGRIVKDKDSLIMFKFSAVTFLSFPVPRSYILPALGSQKIFIVSRVETTIDTFDKLSIPIGDIKDVMPSLKDEEIDSYFTRTSTDNLIKIFDKKI